MRTILLTALVSAGLVLTPSAAMAVPTPAVENSPSTTITFKVRGCEGCVFGSATTPAGSVNDNIFNGPKAKVHNGIATMIVPTAETAGMYFNVTAPWNTRINAEPLLVFQYQNAAPGSRPTKAQNKASKRASACWPGTTAGAVTLHVAVRRVIQPAFLPGKPDSHKTTAVPMAWVLPTVAALKPFWPTYKGVLASQNSVDCVVPGGSGS